MTPIPPATTHKRQVTPTIRTSQNTGTGWVKAEYVSKTVYDSPQDAPLYARLSEQGAGRSQPTGKWVGEIVIQTFHHSSESDALFALLEALEQLELTVEPEAMVIAIALRAAIADDRPWEEQPLGARDHKPRRKRHTWLDQTTGKRVNIYPETLRRHADPNCPCLHCIRHNARTTTKKRDQ